MKIIKKTVVILIPPILSFFIAFFGLFISSYLESIFYEQLFPNLQGNLFVSREL